MADDQVRDAPYADLVEELAALEHERWAHWQDYVHAQGQRRPDGSILLPANLVARWERQIKTSYKDLTNEERESDREQVRRYFPLLVKWLSKSGYNA